MASRVGVSFTRKLWVFFNFTNSDGCSPSSFEKRANVRISHLIRVFNLISCQLAVSNLEGHDEFSNALLSLIAKSFKKLPPHS